MNSPELWVDGANSTAAGHDPGAIARFNPSVTGKPGPSRFLGKELVSDT